MLDRYLISKCTAEVKRKPKSLILIGMLLRPETDTKILYLQIVVPEITPKYPFIFSTFCRFIFLTLLGILILSFPFSGQENRAK